jgi:hypothetical protein
MNHSEVAHRFASQWGDKPNEMTLSGRGCNLSFNGPALYSYGTVIMRFCEFKKKPYLLVNTSGYSNSTCKHLGHARRATNHIAPQFSIHGKDRGESLLGVSGKDLYAQALENAASYQVTASRARLHKSFALEQAERCMKEAQAISDFFCLRKKVDEGAIAKLVKEKEAAEKQYAKERAEQAKRRAERDAEELKEIEESLEVWVKGGITGGHGLHRLPVRLRTVEGKEGPTVETLKRTLEIETSHGAVIPYEEGRKCYRFCARLWRQGKTWARNGERFMVGPYHLDLVTCDGIKAGCHDIHRQEIERFAAQEGWIQSEADSAGGQPQPSNSLRDATQSTEEEKP